AEVFSWPDRGTTPFRSEKDTNWQGGWRVPGVIRGPGGIKPGTVFNDLFAHEDMLPTLMAAAGEPAIADKAKAGYRAGDQPSKGHRDGYTLLPYLKGDAKEVRGREFLYWSEDGDLMAFRYDKWKAVFAEQRAEGFAVWSEPLVKLRVPR